MVQLELTLDEASTLQQLITSCISDLRVEIRHTDNREFRAELRKQEMLLKKLLQQLERRSAQVPA